MKRQDASEAQTRTRIFGCRLSSREELGDIKGGLYAARLNLQLFLSLNPHEDPRDVVVVEATQLPDGTVHERYLYAFDMLAGAELERMEGEAERFAAALAADEITPDDFA